MKYMNFQHTPKAKIKYYQPEYNEDIWEENGFHSWFIFNSKEVAQSAFPTLIINEYCGDDIEDPEFVDNIYKTKN